MGDQKIVAESSSPPQNSCRYGDECYLKTFSSYPADNGCYLKTFPTGYRFKPSDLELISHYLMNRISGKPLPPNLIQKVKVYDSTPAELTEKYKEYAVDGSEWYFFTDRERKYPKGVRPRRDTGSNSAGFWKATGNPDEIKDSRGRKMGSKRTLVYYEWKPKTDSPNKEGTADQKKETRESTKTDSPNKEGTADQKKETRESTKTDFKMHEYVMENAAKPARQPDRANMEHATDQDGRKDKQLDLVLCKIYWNPGKAKINPVPAAGSSTPPGSTPPGSTPPSEDSVTSKADEDDSDEAFVDPFPFFGIGLPSSLENALFERELIEEYQTDDFFNNLTDLTDQQRSLINCCRANLPVSAQQQSRQVKPLQEKQQPK